MAKQDLIKKFKVNDESELVKTVRELGISLEDAAVYMETIHQTQLDAEKKQAAGASARFWTLFLGWVLVGGGSAASLMSYANAMAEIERQTQNLIFNPFLSQSPGWSTGMTQISEPFQIYWLPIFLGIIILPTFRTPA